MGIVSYAQNREDVRLARVLTAPTGFYIDVGASDPTVHSLTRHFAERGWRGLNVEPCETGAAALQRERPHDVTVQAVVGRTNGEAAFFELTVPELREVSTSVPARAAELVKAGRTVVERRLPMWTLAHLCEQHAPSTIDFLSIDVEGAEADVIAGADWRRFRPRIVLVETLDMTTMTPSHAAWEGMLLDADYVFAVDDGINRFYVAREEAATLVEPLARPVSWLDRFEPYEYRQEIERVRAEARTTVATQVLSDAAARQANAMWAAYDGLRDELIRLRQRVDVYERLMAGHEAMRAAGGGMLGGPAGHGGIGPIWLALAARATRLSRRYPLLSTKIKAGVIGMHRRVRRMRGPR